jgi:protein SCO1/2
MNYAINSFRAAVILTALLFIGEANAHSEHGKVAEQEAPRSDEPSMRGAYGGPFILQDQNGKTVSDEDYRGKFMLLTFGYTSCGDVCPTILQSMAKVMDLLGEPSKEVQPLFISLDPKRDTPPKLREYVAAFHPRLIGLTGPEPYVAAAARKYRIKYQVVEGKNGDYSIDHTAVVFLMGPDGAFQERFSMNTTPEDMARRIAKRITDTPKPEPEKATEKAK